MPTNAEYEQRIGIADNAVLQGMLANIKRGRNIRGWSIGRALEYVVLRQFQIEGAVVTWPFDVSLENEVVEQIDGAVHYQHVSSLLECKDHASAVNVEPFAKLRNQLLRRPPGTIGMLFARSGYTQPAKVLARYMTPLSVLLWEFEELESAIQQQCICQGLLTKYQYAVELGIPDYDIRGGLR